jgi:negative regulator of flagellin synthesis FlgM
VTSKINGFGGSQPAAVGTGKIAQSVQSTSSGATSASSGGSGSIHITDAASQLASLEQAARDLPAVDDTRVAAIQSAIEQGTYTVSPDGIADNLMQMERSLGQLS